MCHLLNGSKKRKTAQKNWRVGLRYCKIPAVDNETRSVPYVNNISGAAVRGPDNANRKEV